MMEDKFSPEDLSEELEHSYQMAKKLLPFLAKRNIPATPKNYRLFYDYLAYKNTALPRILNELIDAQVSFDNRLSDKLYDYFYSADALESQALVINQATEHFEAVSSIIAQSLVHAIDKASHYQKVLNEKSKQLSAAASELEWQKFFDEVMDETSNSIKSQDKLVRQIEESNQTIASLRAELSNQATLARVDELTQLYNRRHLNLELPKILQYADQSQLPVSILLFDLDYFKKVNDVWGHQLGDKVLALCAQTIKKAARQDDLAVRFGGEEFLLCCPGLAVEEALKVAERIRETISDTDITVRGEILPITVSVGVTQYCFSESIEDLLYRVDQALYRAKSEGRNRVILR